MAVLGKLFGKKEDDDDFLSYDKAMPGGGAPGPAGLGVPGGDLGLGAPAALPSIAPQMVQKDMELITSKLDALRVSMDTILQRLANIEARLSQQQPAAPQQPQQQQSFGFGAQQPQQQQQPQDTGWHF